MSTSWTGMIAHMPMNLPMQPSLASSSTATASGRPKWVRALVGAPGEGLSTPLLLAAIGALVVLVSLPRLRDFVLCQNELDAVAALGLLGPLADEAPARARLAALVGREPSLERALADARALDGGRVLSHHGYFMALSPGPDGPIVFAWPASARRTGLRAYARTPDGRLFVHPNRETPWSGLRRRPAAPATGTLDAPWRPAA